MFIVTFSIQEVLLRFEDFKPHAFLRFDLSEFDLWGGALYDV